MDKISDFLRQNPNKIAQSIRPEQNAEEDEHDARCLLNARQILIEAAQLHDMAPPNHSEEEKRHGKAHAVDEEQQCPRPTVAALPA